MIELFLSVLSGFLLILVFPKFNMFFLAYVALVPLFISLRRAKNWENAAFLGLICGAVYFGGVLFWINILSKWAGTWAYSAWLALAVFQGLFIAFFAAVYKISLSKLKFEPVIAGPLIWAATEWLRSLGPYGVTGGGLSYSQVDLLPLIQTAHYLGPYAVSFFVVLVNEAVTSAVIEKKYKQLAAVIAAFLICLALGQLRIATYKETGKPIDIAVIQANIAQDVKLDYGLAYEIVDTHENLSRKALSLKPQIIVWPETAVTTYLFETRTILGQVQKLVKDSRTYYMIGTPYRYMDRIYNSVVAFSPDGKYIGRYDKQRLVPFGEYLPMRPLFFKLLQENPLFSEDYNSDQDPQVIDLGIAKVGVVICFESTFPYMVRDKVKKGAQFILVATNDAWFFDTAAVYQHIQSDRMRAVESGRYVVQAANTGISALIDPLGRVVKATNQGETSVLNARVFIH